MASRRFFNFDPFDAFLDPFGSYSAQQYRQPYDAYNAPYTQRYGDPRYQHPAGGRRAQGSHWIDDFFPYRRPAEAARAPVSRKTRKPAAEEKSVPIQIRVDGPDPKPKPKLERKAAASVARKRAPTAEEAAVRLQARVRGLLARESFRAVVLVHREALAAWKTFCNKAEVLRRDERERAAAGELLMKMLLRLDTVRGARGYRRKITKMVIAMQDAVEAFGKPKLPKEAVEETVDTKAAEAIESEVAEAAEETKVAEATAAETEVAEAVAEETLQVEEVVAVAEQDEAATQETVQIEEVQDEAAAEEEVVAAAAQDDAAAQVEEVVAVVVQDEVAAVEEVEAAEVNETQAEEVEAAAAQAEVVAEEGTLDATDGNNQLEDNMAVETTGAQDAREHIDKRQSEANRIREKYPDTIPVIVEKAERISLEETTAAPDTTEHSAEIESMDAADTPTKMEADMPTKMDAEGCMTAGEAEAEAKGEQGVNVEEVSNAEDEWEMVPEAPPFPCLEPAREEIVFNPANDGGTDIEKMVAMVISLSEQNTQQSALIAALAERVDALECTVRRMEEDREATTASSTASKD